MTTQQPLGTTTDTDERGRRRKALLAGGLVLGLGAAVTLAAWSDDVFANGTFKTGAFELEGNVTTTNVASSAAVPEYQKYDESPGGELSFRQTVGGTAVALQYNEEVFAPLSVRLSPDTTVDGTYTLASVQLGDGYDPDLNGALRYRVLTGVDAVRCDAQDVASGADWFAGPITPSPGSGPTVAGSPRSLSAAAATQDQLCLGVTLTSNEEAVQGATDTVVVWKFTATADSN